MIKNELQGSERNQECEDGSKMFKIKKKQKNVIFKYLTICLLVLGSFVTGIVQSVQSSLLYQINGNAVPEKSKMNSDVKFSPPRTR